jgi:glycosyltransferase involved in cell wall biosynthesis
MLSNGPRVVAYAHAVHANGGMERAQREVILGLLDRGWRVRVVARAVDLPAHELLETQLVRVPERPAPIEQLGFAARAPRSRRAGNDIVTSLGAIVPWPVDVVIVQYVNRTARGARNGGETRGPLALRLNAALNHEIAVGLERWCYRQGHVSRFLPVSAQLRDALGELYRWAPAASLVVPNGVDRDHFAPDADARARSRAQHGIAAADRVAVFVGGDWERKGLRAAVEALASADDWHLLVVGRGAPAASRETATRLGFADRLHFAGQASDPAPLLAAGDAFVLPTRYEGFPLSAIEAASCGLPLLLTRESNADGLLLDGETGFWIERNGASIATRLDELRNPVVRDRLAQAARRVAARFSWSEIVEQHVAVYEEILRARRDR